MTSTTLIVFCGGRDCNTRDGREKIDNSTPVIYGMNGIVPEDKDPELCAKGEGVSNAIDLVVTTGVKRWLVF